MGAVGSCFDNAVAETFFATLTKEELLHPAPKQWATRAELRSAIFEYIEGFYNPIRLHWALGMRFPVEFEADHAAGDPDGPRARRERGRARKICAQPSVVHSYDDNINLTPGNRGRSNPQLLDYKSTSGHGDSRYSYGASVRKNRELFLKKLEPEWVVGIDAHAPDKALSTAEKLLTGNELVAAVAGQTGFDSYADAFNKTITALSTGAKPPALKGDTDKAFDKGVVSATTYMEGHAAGKTEFAAFRAKAVEVVRSLPSKNQARKRKKDFFPPKPGDTTARPALTEIQQMAGFYACMQVEDFGQQPTFDVDGFTAMTYLSSKREKYPIYWIGWAHGAAKKVPQRMDAKFYAGTTETVT